MAAQDLTTLAKVRAYIQKQTPDTGQDTVLSDLITRASDAIMRYAGREFAPATTSAVREYEWDGGRWLDLAPYDLRALTQLRVNSDEASPTIVASTDYRLFPYPSSEGVFTALRLERVYNRSWLFRNARLELTGSWGFASVPSDVEQACIVTVAVWLRRDVSAFSTIFSIDEQKLERPEALPSGVKGLLAPYKRAIVA